MVRFLGVGVRPSLFGPALLRPPAAGRGPASVSVAGYRVWCIHGWVTGGGETLVYGRGYSVLATPPCSVQGPNTIPLSLAASGLIARGGYYDNAIPVAIRACFRMAP